MSDKSKVTVESLYTVIFGLTDLIVPADALVIPIIGGFNCVDF